MNAIPILERGTSNPFDGKGQYAWDSTSLGWAETCFRLYQYNMIERWSPMHQSEHLRFGGHYATALEHFHKALALDSSREDALRQVVREALIDTIGWRSTDANKTRETLIRSIVWYIDHFADDPMETVILADGSPAVELSFTVELDPDILYCGHIDRLVSYAGGYYIQDQKTTKSTISPSFFEKFNPNTQLTGYPFAGAIMYKMPIKGVVIDAAQIAVGFTRFERGFTARTQAQLEEWRVDALDTIHKVREATVKSYFPMNRSSCDKFGGCAFRTVCSRSPEVRPQFLKAEFKQREGWNPLERR